MIPILYRESEREFATNGIGRLVDCIRCTVTEERNGIYECEFDYPITGQYYDEIRNGRIVSCIHDDKGDRQPFVIYRASRPINGVVTFNARHISYNLTNVIVGPFTASTAAEAISKIPLNLMTGNEFTFWTDKNSSGTFSLDTPASVRSILGGTEGSLLDAFGGGEYAFDNFTVRLYSKRGNDTGVTIRYGKNMTDLVHEEENGSTYNGIVPYYSDGSGEVVYGSAVVAAAPPVYEDAIVTDGRIEIETDGGEPLVADYAPMAVVPMDFTNQFQGEVPTAAELEAAAASYLASNKPWRPIENIKVDFVALWQTDEYADVALLQRVGLCDYVSVYYPALGVEAYKTEVIRTVYNVLLERYDEMELGDAVASFADVLKGTFTGIMEENSVTRTVLDAAISSATALITGGMGGHILFRYDGNGKPTEMLVMDTEDEATAMHVLRINVNGIGFSSNGVNGPFTSAWTLDGAFVADFITAGEMSANRIRGGVIRLGGGDYGNGMIAVNDEDGNQIGWWSSAGFHLLRGSIGLDANSSVSVNGGPGQFIAINSAGLQGLSNGVRMAFSNGELQLITDGYASSSEYDASDVYSTGFSTSHVVSGDQTKNKNGRLTPTYVGVRDGSYSSPRYFSVDIPTHSALWTGSWTVSGTKSRLADTEEFGERLLYCYEMPSPVFGDLGEGVIGEDGLCYVPLDPVFEETVTIEQYQVFLQKYGDGEAYVKERRGGWFVVAGTPGLAFGWEIKAKQKGFDQLRLDRVPYSVEEQDDYGQMALDYLKQLKEGRTA